MSQTEQHAPEWSAQTILQTLERHRDKLRELGVRRIGLFGSYSRGEATPESDMDFLVDLEPVTFKNYMAVLFFLEDLFGRDVDLVREPVIRPVLRPYIMADVIYAQGV